MELFFVAIILVGIAFAAIGINIFFRKEGKFPETEVGRNSNMKRLGITCPKCDEMLAWREINRRKRTKIKPSELKLDLNSMK
jgi:hypothetical protein